MILEIGQIASRFDLGNVIEMVDGVVSINSLEIRRNDGHTEYEYQAARNLTLDSTNDDPIDIWSYGEYLYVLEDGSLDVFRYNLSDNSLDNAKYISLPAGYTDVRAIYGTDTRIYIISKNSTETRVLVYSVSDASRQSSEEYTLDSAGCTDPVGFVIANDIHYILDATLGKICAFSSAGVEDTTKEIDLDSDTVDPSGMYTNEVTIWVISSTGQEAFAYDIDSMEYNPDINDDLTQASNPVGGWYSNGVLYIADDASAEQTIHVFTAVLNILVARDEKLIIDEDDISLT